MSKNKSKTTQRGTPPKSQFWASIKLLLIIVVLVLIPLSLREFDVQTENLAWIGRIVGAICLTLLLYGLMKHSAKIVMILAGALILFMVLASEGHIDLPKLFGQ
jgi:membrane-bound ClpP family serine protease